VRDRLIILALLFMCLCIAFVCAWEATQERWLQAEFEAAHVQRQVIIAQNEAILERVAER
jgi:hypothetical protein